MRLTAEKCNLIVMLAALSLTLITCLLIDYSAFVSLILLCFIMICFTLYDERAGAVSLAVIVIFSLYRCNRMAISDLLIVLLMVLIYVLMTIYQRRIAALKRQNEQLKQASDHDALTGVYNRRGGDARVAELMSAGKTSQLPQFRAMLAALDIDNFKEINDVYGHAIGDGALTDFANALKEMFDGHTVLIRNGGDEFQAFMYECDFESVEHRLHDFCKARHTFTYQRQTISYYVSSGYAFYPDQALDQKNLYRKADAALYDVKMNGKHNAMLFKADYADRDSNKLKFSMRKVSENLPIAFMVYRADEQEKILVVSRTLINLCGCDDFDSFIAHTGGTFHGFVHPDDINRVESEIAAQIRCNRYGLDSVNYRIIRKDGSIIRVHDLGRFVDDPSFGQLFYVALYDRDALLASISNENG